MNPDPAPRGRTVSERDATGTNLRFSTIGFELSLSSTAFVQGDRRAAELLRRAHAAGVTTFAVPAGPLGPRAERLLGSAFPAPESSIVVLSGRSIESLASSARDTPGTPAATSLADRLRVALEVTEHRLPPGSSTLVLWDAADATAEELATQSAVLDELVDRDRIRGWARRLEPGRPPSGPDWRDDRPRLFSTNLSLLEPRAADLLHDRSTRAPTGLIVGDPFAEGRLDGTRFVEAVGSRSPDAAPPRIRELRRDFAPVLRLGFLTADRRRTLAQAAIQYALQQPGVVSVLVPLPEPERLTEILNSEGVPELGADELDRVRGAGGAKSPDSESNTEEEWSDR